MVIFLNCIPVAFRKLSGINYKQVLDDLNVQTVYLHNIVLEKYYWYDFRHLFNKKRGWIKKMYTLIKQIITNIVIENLNMKMPNNAILYSIYEGFVFCRKCKVKTLVRQVPNVYII